MLIVQSVKDAPRSFRTQRAYGDLLFEKNKRELAHEAYSRALDYSPPATEWRVRNNYAKVLQLEGETALAAEQLRASLAQQPRQEYVRGELIVAELSLGNYIEAEAQADTSIALGENAAVFEELRAIADSAERVHAPAGSIRVTIQASELRPNR